MESGSSISLEDLGRTSFDSVRAVFSFLRIASPLEIEALTQSSKVNCIG